MRCLKFLIKKICAFRFCSEFLAGWETGGVGRLLDEQGVRHLHADDMGHDVRVRALRHHDLRRVNFIRQSMTN